MLGNLLLMFSQYHVDFTELLIILFHSGKYS